LFHISKILNTSVPDLLEVGTLLQQTNNESATGYQQKIEKIENFYQENKEIYEKLLQSKEEQIELLKSFLEKMKGSHGN